MLIVATFQHANLPEGSRVSYSLTELDEKGRTLRENIRGNFVVLNDEVQAHIDAIRDYILSMQEE